MQNNIKTLLKEKERTGTAKERAVSSSYVTQKYRSLSLNGNLKVVRENGGKNLDGLYKRD
jgi:hypothetical protein